VLNHLATGAARRAVLAAGLAVAVSACSGSVIARTRPAESDAAVPLPSAFHLDASEHMFVKVSVNGKPSVWMLIDTGTTPSAINAHYAKSIGLEHKAKQERGAGAGSDPIRISRATVRSLQCGSFVRRNVRFVTVDYSRPGPDGKPVAGLLGYSFLRNHTLILDYPKSTAAISNARLPRQSSVPFTFINDVPVVRVSLNQHNISALLDTGGGYQLLLTPDTAERIGLRSSQAGAIQTSGVGYGGTQVMQVGPGPGFSVGNFTTTTSEITYMPLPIRVDGALGTHFFKDYRVELDYRSKRARFSKD